MEVGFGGGVGWEGIRSCLATVTGSVVPQDEQMEAAS